MKIYLNKFERSQVLTLRPNKIKTDDIVTTIRKSMDVVYNFIKMDNN